MALDSYHFPVESMVVDPRDGRVLSQINANFLLDIDNNNSSAVNWFMEDPINTNYMNFLKLGQANAS